MYIEVIEAHGILSFTDVSSASEYFSTLEPIDVRLDLHGVLDILPLDSPLISSRIACISFVGPNTHTSARIELQDRIKSGQITIGILVFKRGRGKTKHRFIEEGSKAWVHSQIPFTEKCIYIDDSTDHLRSTQYLVPAITCILFHTKVPSHFFRILETWKK